MTRRSYTKATVYALFVRARVCMCACVRVCMYVCMYVCMCARACVNYSKVDLSI